MSGELQGQGCPTDKDFARLCVSCGHWRPPPEVLGPLCVSAHTPGAAGARQAAGAGRLPPQVTLGLTPFLRLGGRTGSPAPGQRSSALLLTPRFRARGPRGLRESETRRRGEVPFSPSLCRNPLCQTGPERGAARCGDAAAQTLAPALPCDDVTACVVGKHVSRGSLFQGHLLPGPVCIVLNIRLRIRTKRTSTCLES